MRNIDKLVKFLVNDSDKETLSKSTATDIESVGKFTDYVIDRILPEDFLIQEGSHVEEKDLNSLVRNFNDLLKEENLKPVIIEGMKRAEIKPNQASALMSNLLPVIHEKIKVLMSNAAPSKSDNKISAEEKNMTNPVYSKDSEHVGSDNGIDEAFDDESNETFSKKDPSNLADKVLMALIAVCLVAIIAVLVFILVKVNVG